LELRRRQKACCGCDFDGCFGPNHRRSLVSIKSVIKTR
jgi:hypothetical protein